MSQRPRSLVLVSGAGRSGTSTIAGTFDRLGHHVPVPVMKANGSNPKGFYESLWPVRFHKRLLESVNVDQSDGRPWAASLVEGAFGPEVRQELTDWLTEQFASSPRLVVKDPRSAWAAPLWADAAADLGVSLGYLTMLRHPAETVGSRTTYYRHYRPGTPDDAYAAMTLAGWINANLVVERATRGRRRVWVGYADLLADWRPQLERVSAELDVELDDDEAAVDEFITPRLRRHDGSWEGLDVPGSLREVAESVWTAGLSLVDSDGPDAHRLFDAASTAFTDLYRASVAIANDELTARLRAARASYDVQLAETLDATAPADGVPARVREPRRAQRWLRRR